MIFEEYAPDFSYILRRDILHQTGGETKTKNIHHQTEKEGNKGKEKERF